MSLNFKKRVRPIGTTFVLSCLIWIYADQINSESRTELITLQVSSQSGSKMDVQLQEPATGQLQVTFTGPHEQLNQLRLDLSSGKFKPVYYVQPEEAKGEVLVKDGADVINTLLRKNYSACSVVESRPAQIKIFIDQLTTVKMPVYVTTGTTKTTTPVVKPSQIDVTLSQSFFQSLSDSDKFIVVDIENELQGKAVERVVDEEFPLPQVLMGQPVVTEPTRVRIQLQIQQQFSTTNLVIQRVQVLGPDDLLSKYRVDMREQKITVELQGPEELIKNLKPQDIIAYLALEPEDMYRQWNTYFARQLKFLLPEGIKLNTEKMTRPPEVDFKLIDQSIASPVGPR